MTKVGKSHSKGTFAGAFGNDEDAPIPARRGLEIERQNSGRQRSRATRISTRARRRLAGCSCPDADSHSPRISAAFQARYASGMQMGFAEAEKIRLNLGPGAR
jgi:hypothetical protein